MITNSREITDLAVLATSEMDPLNHLTLGTPVGGHGYVIIIYIKFIFRLCLARSLLFWRLTRCAVVDPNP